MDNLFDITSNKRKNESYENDFLEEVQRKITVPIGVCKFKLNDKIYEKPYDEEWIIDI
jgi:hypothetical protein